VVGLEAQAEPPPLAMVLTSYPPPSGERSSMRMALFCESVTKTRPAVSTATPVGLQRPASRPSPPSKPQRFIWPAIA